MITVDELPAGLAFVTTPHYIPSTPDIQYFLNEFFLLRPYRSKGVGEAAATKVVDQFPGKWELQTGPMEGNVRAQKFWRKALSQYTNDQYIESEGHHPDTGKKIKFQFNNA